MNQNFLFDNDPMMIKNILYLFDPTEGQYFTFLFIIHYQIKEFD